eukprot:3301082-Rhodomonas_salina.1
MHGIYAARHQFMCQPRTPGALDPVVRRRRTEEGARWTVVLQWGSPRTPEPPSRPAQVNLQCPYRGRTCDPAHQRPVCSRIMSLRRE